MSKNEVFFYLLKKVCLFQMYGLGIHSFCFVLFCFNSKLQGEMDLKEKNVEKTVKVENYWKRK